MTINVNVDDELVERIDEYWRNEMPGVTTRAPVVRQLLMIGLKYWEENNERDD